MRVAESPVPGLHQGGLPPQDWAQPHRRVQEAVVHLGRQEAHVPRGGSRCLRQGKRLSCQILVFISYFRVRSSWATPAPATWLFLDLAQASESRASASSCTHLTGHISSPRRRSRREETGLRLLTGFSRLRLCLRTTIWRCPSTRRGTTPWHSSAGETFNKSL